MAGGRFDPLVGKTLPGAYTNFESTRQDVVGVGERGTVLIPLIDHDYGPGKTFITLTNAAPDKELAKLGYSIYDNDPTGNMLLIREAFKRAQKVIVYITESGTQATGSGGEAIAGSAAEFSITAKSIGFSETPTPHTNFRAQFGADASASVGVATGADVFSTPEELAALFADTSFTLGGKIFTASVSGADIIYTADADGIATAIDGTIRVFALDGSGVETEIGVDADSYSAVFTQGAEPQSGNLTATAKYGGSRGNKLTVSSVPNPIGGFDVSVFLDAELVSFYEGLTTMEQLIAQNDPYITFAGTGELTAVAGLTLDGGADGAASNSDISKFLDDMEKIRFNTVAFPVEDATLKAALKTKIKYLREDVGRGVQAAAPNFDTDYEGIISVTNAVALGDVQLTPAQACAWVAAASAAASYVESNTYKVYDGATAVVGEKDHDEAVAAVKKGEFFFSVSEAGDIIVQYDINSLTSFVKPKDKTYAKNRVVRVFDTFQESLQLNFPPNKYDNSPDGWDIMEGVGRAILFLFSKAKAVKNVDYNNDFKIDRSLSTGDETYFNVGLEPIDSAEKLFFTIKTR